MNGSICPPSRRNESEHGQWPNVSVKCNWYVVDFGPEALGQRYHTVDKRRRCTCGQAEKCIAVQAVATYLWQGGERAPDPREDLWLSVPKACPICNGAVAADSGLNCDKHGFGWRCLTDASHYWQARLRGRLRALR